MMKVLTALPLIIFGTIFNGYVLSVLWRWFIVPVFDLPEISIIYAIGITMIITDLTHQVDNREQEDKNETFGGKIIIAISAAVLRPAFTLLFGFIVHLFV